MPELIFSFFLQSLQKAVTVKMILFNGSIRRKLVQIQTLTVMLELEKVTFSLDAICACVNKTYKAEWLHSNYILHEKVKFMCGLI